MVIFCALFAMRGVRRNEPSAGPLQPGVFAAAGLIEFVLKNGRWLLQFVCVSHTEAGAIRELTEESGTTFSKDQL